MSERSVRLWVGLSVVVVLFLVIMPALLYLVGWGAQRYVGQTPVWNTFPPPPKLPAKQPEVQTPAKATALADLP